MTNANTLMQHFYIDHFCLLDNFAFVPLIVYKALSWPSGDKKRQKSFFGIAGIKITKLLYIYAIHGALPSVPFR